MTAQATRETVAWHKGHRLRVYWDHDRGGWRVHITCDSLSAVRPTAGEAEALAKTLIDLDFL